MRNVKNELTASQKVGRYTGSQIRALETEIRELQNALSEATLAMHLDLMNGLSQRISDLEHEKEFLQGIRRDLNMAHYWPITERIG
jgi:septal ring factor EnvC (AmiA/AmiB activator)